MLRVAFHATGDRPRRRAAIAFACRQRSGQVATFLNAVTVQYAKELHDTNLLINAACPGFVATDLNGFRGLRTPEQGAAIAIRLATLANDGPTGQFFDDAGEVPW